jgi:uncharacterized protein DUF4407
MNNFDLLTKFLLNCAGADHSTMAQCTSSEVRKYKIMGTCVLIPAVLALFSGGYAMYLISQSETLAYLFAPVWGLIIFTLDRAVVSTTRPGKVSLGVVGRIFLSIIIAFTISEPIVLRLFSDSIEDKRISIIDEKQTAATSQFDNQILKLKSESVEEKTKLDVLSRSYVQEVDGTGGSRVAYRGPIAEVKYQTYQKALSDYNKNEDNRNAELSKLGTERKHKLQLVSDKDAKGFLGNMRILGRLSDEDPHVMWSTWLIRLLFLCIELIPVFIKLGNSADYGLFDKLKDMNDETCFGLQKMLVEEKRDVMKIEQSILLQEQKSALMFQQIKGLMNSKLKDYEYFLDKIKYAMEQQLKLKIQLIEKIKDEDARTELINQVTRIYEGYVATLESMVEKSNLYHSTTGVNVT